eukprot:CAMPEP_0197238454 /NCGR_PEP_ID=MMETSP1429-20130617/4929_1 /TAXON_ID=49237 /ORGANISM="Chaetoceros  sp., Strain UNC1202" /LENGTH=551 /DNA_ID=CAMNT_0042697609 /DNA_START=33 /DNA_END=1689 /DNA_ORIENTATION=+
METITTVIPYLWAPLYLTCALAALYAIFAYYIYVTCYADDFGGKRLTRDSEFCPSNTKMDPPAIKNFQWNKDRVLKNASHHENFNDCELLGPLENNAGKQYSRQFISALQKDKASRLDMDHVYLSFSEVLWAFTFIGPASFLYWKQGTTRLRIRAYLAKVGIIKKKPVDLNELAAKIVLEQSQVIHYYARTDKDSKLGNIAGFFFADFPYVDMDGKFHLADLLAVDIDLDTKRMVKCKMDDEALTPQEAVNLLWYGLISYQHVKLHSIANWGVNCDAKVKEINPFLHRNSIITVIYNYFGFSSFPRFMKEWEEQGLLSAGWDPKSLTKTFVHGAIDNIWQHSQIKEMQPYSDLVTFIVKVRAIFHSEFKKYKDLFPNVHCEALFVGTVLHSLDHALMDWNMEDPLWLDVDDPKFGKMAELGRIVKVGFVGDIPGFYFHHRFQGSGHPFYESVYAKASKINKRFADNMDIASAVKHKNEELHVHTQHALTSLLLVDPTKMHRTTALTFQKPCLCLSRPPGMLAEREHRGGEPVMISFSLSSSRDMDTRIYIV